MSEEGQENNQSPLKKRFWTEINLDVASPSNEWQSNTSTQQGKPSAIT